MKLLFVHRSVGQQLLDDGGWRSLAGVDVYDLNANTNVMTGPDGEPVESTLSVSDGTDPAGFAKFFTNIQAEPSSAAELKSFDVLAFKSCYSASKLESDDELEKAKAVYRGPIRKFISSQPQMQFVVFSPPPRRPLMTNAVAAKRAREFARFLQDFASELPNAEFYDTFSVLANDRNMLSRSFRRLLPFDQHPNGKGAKIAGAKAGSLIANIKLG